MIEKGRTGKEKRKWDKGRQGIGNRKGRQDWEKKERKGKRPRLR